MRKATNFEESSAELLDVLEQQERELLLPSFGQDIAWEIGTLLRKRFVEEKVPRGLSAGIQIRGFPHGHHDFPSILFATTAGPNAAPGLGRLIAGKANVVQAMGLSTYLTRVQFKQSRLPLEEFGFSSPEYFLHGGGFPIRLVNHPTPIAVIVVSGMPSQAEDHQVDTLAEYLDGLRKRT